MNDRIAVCDKCGFELSNFEGRTAGCSHASCGGTFIAQDFNPSKNCKACQLHRDHTKEQHEALIRRERNAARRERHAAMTSLGLKRVKGALGGTYYE